MELGGTISGAQRLDRLEEVLWVTQAQAGDSEAFVRLLARYEKPLLYYLRRLVPEGDAALDLHQEVWIDVFRGLRSLEVPEAFRVWLYRIAHHKAARFVRKEILHGEMARTLSEAQAGEPTPESIDAIDSEELHQALARLAPHHREVLVLYYLRELSTDELAAVLACPTGTIKSRLFHARAALRRVIERKYHESNEAP